MPGTQPRGVDVVVGDRTLRLVYDINALIWLEDTTGTDLDGLDAAVEACRAQGSVSLTNLKVLRNLFYAGLRREQPTLTLEDAGGMIFLETAREISESIADAMGGREEFEAAVTAQEGLHADSPLPLAVPVAPAPSGPAPSTTMAYPPQTPAAAPSPISAS